MLLITAPLLVINRTVSRDLVFSRQHFLSKKKSTGLGGALLIGTHLDTTSDRGDAAAARDYS